MVVLVPMLMVVLVPVLMVVLVTRAGACAGACADDSGYSRLTMISGADDYDEHGAG